MKPSPIRDLPASGTALEPSQQEWVAAWLRLQTQALAVRVTQWSKLSGGAIQDNWALDVEVDGGLWSGDHRFVLRTDAASGVSASLGRAQEFAVLRVATTAGVLAPEP